MSDFNWTATQWSRWWRGTLTGSLYSLCFNCGWGLLTVWKITELKNKIKKNIQMFHVKKVTLSSWSDRMISNYNPPVFYFLFNFILLSHHYFHFRKQKQFGVGSNWSSFYVLLIFISITMIYDVFFCIYIYICIYTKF